MHIVMVTTQIKPSTTVTRALKVLLCSIHTRYMVKYTNKRSVWINFFINTFKKKKIVKRNELILFISKN